MKLILVNAAVELHVHKQGQCVHQRPRPHHERGKPTAGERDSAVSPIPPHLWRSDSMCIDNKASQRCHRQHTLHGVDDGKLTLRTQHSESILQLNYRKSVMSRVSHGL